MSVVQFIPRKLVYTVEGAEEEVAHTDLAQRSENLIILGEAGSGKSRLLEELEKSGLPRITARRLIHAPVSFLSGKARVLVDALDESPAFAEGSVVDQVIAKLEQSGVERFALACRSEDWQAATASSIIAETFGALPLELRLVPFNEAQIAEFLAGQLGSERANEVALIYKDRGLHEWLGNPQTLLMVADVARNGEHPNSTSALFQAYVALSLREENAIRRQMRVELSEDDVLNTLGASFAALILSGKSALARPGAPYTDEDLRLSELRTLPGYVEDALNSASRLVRTMGSDTNRLTYSHRRIGEWLAARWLAANARTDAIRERLFASITVNNIVPASLRGVFAWLALDPKSSLRVIQTDPMSVVEYGDADVLSNRQGDELLGALESISKDDPWFAGWDTFRAKALVSHGLQTKTLAAVVDPSRSFRLRMLLARQFKGETLNPDAIRQLRDLALDRNTFYALREDATEALVGNFTDADWNEILEILNGQASHNSTRLSAHIILETGIDKFTNVQVVETIFATCGHLIAAVPPEEQDDMAARAWRFRYEVPDHRLDGILDLMADYALALLPEYRSLESADIINVGDALVARRLRLEPLAPARLLHWLAAFSGRDGYVADDEKTIAAFLLEAHDLRQAIQQTWFAGKDNAQSFFEASYKLSEIHSGLAFSDEDLAAFLKSVPDDFVPWRAAAGMIRHSEIEGVQTREALRRFLADEHDYQSLIQELLSPKKLDWQIKNEKRAVARKAERDKAWAGFREGMSADRLELEQGRFGIILQAANVYLGRYSDLSELKTALERLEALCGPELTKSVMVGLESYLAVLPPYPSALVVANDYALSKAWNARYILLATLAERVRRTGSLGELIPDQLISAQLHLAHQAISGEEWKPLKEAVWTAICGDPSLFESYARLLIEPSLRKRQEFIFGLHEMLHEGSAAYPELVAKLAREWLHSIPRMHSRPEAALIDMLLARRDFAVMRPLIARRLKMMTLDEARRRNWQAVGLVCDFERYAPELETYALIEPAFFWAVRERIGARRPYDDAPDHIPTKLAAWLVEHFRTTFQAIERPKGVTSGDTNLWDATEAVRRLIDRVGTDTSDEAGALLEELSQFDDGYRERVLAVLAEYRRNRAELARVLVGVDSLAALLSDGPPQSLPDLQSRLLHLLARIEAQAKSNDTDSWQTFYRDNRKTPHDEEYCRNRVIDMLRVHEQSIQFSPEKHLGNDREGDIACEYANLHLPIEVKGQWHDDLWRAADAQLAAQQAVDHRAEGYGILLVLWFGGRGKALKGPPRGSGIPKPKTPAELEVALTKNSVAAKDGRVRVKVLDLSRA